MESNDCTAMMTVEPAPVVGAMPVDDGNNESSTSCIHSTTTNVNCSSTPSKKAADKELRQPFPVKVYEMLENAEAKQFSHIVSWNAVGTGFMVHDKDHFTKEIVPHYFNLTKYKSFQRQLSLYGFQRVTVGPNKGLRYHGKLRKGELELVRQMKPVGYKPRNLSRLLGQQKQQQQLGRATNILTTTTTTVVKTTTTSTTLVANDPSKNATNAIPNAANNIIDNASPHNVSITTIPGKALVSDAASTSIPPVVSSNSLIKQEDHDAITVDNKKQQLEQQVHSISPETCHNPIHLTNSGGNDATTGHTCSYLNSNQVGLRAEPEVVNFEGMYFYLMSPTRELGINVKLKLLEEFNPASSLLRLASKYVTTGYTAKSDTDHAATTLPETIPVTIDTVQNDRPSLLEPFTDIISTAAATSTASTIAALQTAVANAKTANNEPTSSNTHSLLPSAKSDVVLETRCIDALDFHSINVTSRI